MRHRPRVLWFAFAAAFACSHPTAPPAPAAATGAAAPAAPRAEQAALYALPLVVMDLTREAFFASPMAADATPDRFLHIPILANPTFRGVIRPNVDTLYSTAWLDLSKEPVVLGVPASDGRYYLVQCMDAWTNVFAAPGVRTLGNRAARYALVGPDWHGPVPAGAEVIHAPTPMVWVLGRIYVRDAADLAAARAFQRQLDLRPASRSGDAAFTAAMPRLAPANRRIMRDVLRELGAAAFFERFARLAAANPPSPPDPAFARDVLATLGLAPGAPLVWADRSEPDRQELAGALDHVLAALDNQVQRRATAPTGWSDMSGLATQGNYGTSYPARAAVAMIGLGANLAADAVYLNTRSDGHQQALDGSKHYRLRFAAGQAPPVRAFWSVTLYDDQGYLIANPAERYAIKSGDDLAREPDGAVVIYLQPDDPGPAHRASWLPTPDGKPFELTLRAYWPGEAMLDGRWQPPAVTAE